MAVKKKRRWRPLVAALVVMVPVVAVVVYSSFTVGAFECEVCITFEGREACRRVNAQTEQEARHGATDNTCAFLASGVTETMRCTRTQPSKVECRPL